MISLFVVENDGQSFVSDQDFLLSNLNLTEEPLSTKKELFSKLTDGSYICNICDKKYKLVGPLKKHLEVNHKVNNAVTFKCRNASQVFCHRSN